MKNSKNKNVQDLVVGNGWAALGVLSQLIQKGRTAVWCVGTGSHYLPPLPAIDSGEAALAWSQAFAVCGTEDSTQTGCFVREYHNKSFRVPSWVKDAEEIEAFWDSERGWMKGEQVRWDGHSLVEKEAELREFLNASPLIQKLENILLKKLTPEGAGWNVELADGSTFLSQNVWIADRANVLNEVEGISRPAVSFYRGRSPHGVLQVVFSHSQAQEFGLEEGIYAPLGRDAGESIQRHVWGYFFDQGRKSVWTVIISPEEAEDNHQVAKKLRKVKQSLDKIFPGFLSRMESEQVRYEEGALYASGKSLSEPAAMPGMKGIFLLTDGYGPSLAMVQASKFTELCTGAVIDSGLQSDSQTEAVNN